MSQIGHYVGITGIQSASEVEALVRSAADFGIGPNHTHNLMLGSLVSPTTVGSAPPVNSTKPYRHVKSFDELVDIILAASEHGIVGMVHMELNKAWPGTDGDSEHVITLLKALDQRGVNPAVQLNGILKPEDIESIARKFPNNPLVLQMRKEITCKGLGVILRYVEGLTRSVSEILLDPSAGSGEVIAVSAAINLHNEIESRFPNTFAFGFAGGLGGASDAELSQTVGIIGEIRREFRDKKFSLDVESKVRVPDEGVDRLELQLSAAYFGAVRNALTEHE